MNDFFFYIKIHISYCVETVTTFLGVHILHSLLCEYLLQNYLS